MTEQEMVDIVKNPAHRGSFIVRGAEVNIEMQGSPLVVAYALGVFLHHLQEKEPVKKNKDNLTKAFNAGLRPAVKNKKELN